MNKIRKHSAISHQPSAISYQLSAVRRKFLVKVLFIVFTIHYLLFTVHCFSQTGLSINTTGAAADKSAMIDVSSTTTGALMPRMTTAQRNAIVSPVESLMIYNTDTHCFEAYYNGSWAAFGCLAGCSPPSQPTAGNNGPVCLNSALSLTASTVSGGTYAWTGPNGFTSALQNPTVSTNATAAMAGAYIVKVTVNGCTSSAGTTDAIVLSVSVPTNVIATPSTVCSGATVNLNATSAGNSINWYTTSTGGTPIGTTASGANYADNPTITTYYWAETFAGSVSSTTFSYTGGIVTYSIPTGVTSVTVTTKGAQGGTPSLGGGPGLGAIESAIFSGLAGANLKILVGGKGCDGNYVEAGGGGGSYVSLSDNTPVCVAGGGGGGYLASDRTYGYLSANGTLSNNGNPGMNGYYNITAGLGGTGGSGGYCSTDNNEPRHSSAGGGFYGNGSACSETCGGASFTNGGANCGTCLNGGGGYGGGGWGDFTYGAGGGGGYSGGGGGGGGGVGGGGGSFYNTNSPYSGVQLPVSASGVNTGDGKVIISYISGSSPCVNRTSVLVTVNVCK